MYPYTCMHIHISASIYPYIHIFVYIYPYPGSGLHSGYRVLNLVLEQLNITSAWAVNRHKCYLKI